MAITFTKVTATDNELVYLLVADGVSVEELTTTTLLADAKAGSTLASILKTLNNNVNGNVNAQNALMTGAGFTLVSGAKFESNIHSRIQAGTIFGVSLFAQENSGATNDPTLLVTADAAGQGWLYITHVHSVVQ